MKRNVLIFALLLAFGLANRSVAQDSLTVWKLTSAPVVDGTVDAVWDAIGWTAIGNGMPAAASEEDLSLQFKIGWFDTKLYVLIDRKDDTLVYDASAKAWEQDNIMAYFDFDGWSDDHITYEGFSNRWWFRIIGNGTATGYDGRHAADWLWELPQLSPVLDYKYTVSGTNIMAEFSVELGLTGWSEFTVEEGASFGFDFEISDCDVVKNRTALYTWNTYNTGSAWDIPTDLGVAILGGLPTSVKELSNSGRVHQIYPNPVQDVLHYSVADAVSEISVYTLSGKQIMTERANGNKGTLDVSGLKSGAYLVKIKGSSQVYNDMIIKK